MDEEPSVQVVRGKQNTTVVTDYLSEESDLNGTADDESSVCLFVHSLFFSVSQTCALVDAEQYCF